MVELFSDGAHLAALEFGHLDGPPALDSPDHGAEHELEDGLFTEGGGNDLEPPAFLSEQPFQEVGGTDRTAMGDGHSEVCDAGLENHQWSRRWRWAVQSRSRRPHLRRVRVRWRGRGLVGGRDPGLELPPQIFGRFGDQIPQPVCEAALTRRSWEAGLERLDDARRAVRDHQQGIAEAALAHVLEKKALTVSASSLEPAIRCSNTLAPLAVKPHAARTGSRFCPGRMRSAMPSMNR